MATGQYKKMTRTSPRILVLKLCVPTIVSMLVTNIYNLADTYFVNKIGIGAGGAVGIVFSLMAIIQAIGFMLGHGSGSIVSQSLGRQQVSDASRIAATAFWASLSGGAILSLLGLCFLKPLMRLLGSTETILPYACNYGRCILIAAPFMTAGCTMNNLLRYEGLAILSMLGLGTGAVLNIVLTPLLMFGFNMGVSGAGVSTAISQAISFSILLSMFLRGRTQCRISIKNITRNSSEFRHILKNGMPSLARQGLNSVSSMVLNHQAGIYGDAAITAVSIVFRICNFISSLAVGIGQGMQPVIGFNYGAKMFRRVRQTFTFTYVLSQLALGCLAMGCFSLSHLILSGFNRDMQVLTVATPMFHIQCFSLLLHPLIICGNMLFQCLGISGKATLLSSLRSGLVLIPLLFILTRCFGLVGLQMSQAISDTIAFIIVLPMVILFMLKLPATDEAPAG